ncbi:hypothetical protein HNR06_004291 [Nocardiopsis arvandica]|uniref:Uncharacterized protein n=1 Tax=Nocardiopsis sinuspersici TaxID=501010 RepID=A0A7Y9XHA4_9ACTN|nr:hypothetical protein [Nocardiopsis sinuspersici]NYH54702.1 hypothetical protein [Nocardiopsis sinuspersici]
MRPPFPATAVRRALSFLTVPLLAVLVVLPAAPANAGPEDRPEGGVSDAEYFAGLLEQRPEGEAVVVHESLAGDYDLAELERSLNDSFGRLDVPYHVVASAVPENASWGRPFLSALQDRVGEPGLYVLLKPGASRVQAMARQVDLPVEEADRVLSWESAFTYYTPLDTMADTFVDTLTAPDLAERAEPRWYAALPAGWWLKHRIDELGLRTVSGPAALGEATAVTAGMTVTVWLLLTAVRSGRRGRATAVGLTARPPGDRALAAGRTLVLLAGTATVAASLIHLNTSALPKEEEQVGPPRPSLAPYVTSTVRVDRVAAQMRDDPLYVDPLAGESAEALSGIAERVAGIEPPVYTAVLPMSRSDESGGDPEVFAHALHHAMDENGVFVVVSAEAGTAPEVKAALFGVALPEEAGRYPLTDVTGTRFDYTAAQALDELLDELEKVSAAPEKEPPVPSWIEWGTEPAPEPSKLSEFASGDFGKALFAVGPLSALAVLALVWSALGAVTRMDTVPGRLLRPRADRAVRRAAKAVQKAPADRAGLDGALRETDAAMAVLGGAPDELDLVGVVVLADRAVRRLDSDPDTAAGAGAPVCMVNPLHGPSVLHGPRHRQPVCASCALLSDRMRERRTLRVAVPPGGRRPHLELDRRWVVTGYGAGGRLDAEDLMGESHVR